MIFRPSFFHGVCLGIPKGISKLVVGTNPSGCFFVSQIGSFSPQFCGMKIKNRFEVSPPLFGILSCGFQGIVSYIINRLPFFWLPGFLQ